MLPLNKYPQKIVAIVSLMVLLSACDNKQVTQTKSAQDMYAQDALWKEHQKNVRTLELIHKNFADVLKDDPMYKAMNANGNQAQQGK